MTVSLYANPDICFLRARSDKSVSLDDCNLSGKIVAGTACMKRSTPFHNLESDQWYVSKSTSDRWEWQFLLEGKSHVRFTSWSFYFLHKDRRGGANAIRQREDVQDVYILLESTLQAVLSK